MKKLVLSLACAVLATGAFAQDPQGGQTPLPCGNAEHKCAPNLMPKMGGFKGGFHEDFKGGAMPCAGDMKNCQAKGAKFGHDMKKFHKMGHNDRYTGAIMRELPRLDLSDEQWAKVRRIMFEANEARIAKKSEPRENLLEDIANFDKAKFIENNSKKFTEQITAEAGVIEALLGVLSSEQKSNLAKNLKERKEKREAQKELKKDKK
ncbi:MULTISPECIES: hypothetical protein [unclassified Campylobacter]|uniref:hypothetical protein n=1 Tax=unclassified Campylobacter TaxID=2593542 RepID=UPI0022E9EF27|nr:MULTISPECIES: hypothetical protein [unclassified Campylobacter]MDA3062222.1 hypothetical protein [Campylobacter sp. JMF_14 EL1]MDA3073659.1 hypothetical protein [Campylobacter sp. JMF_10 EL2]